jgi:hypothetical protein
MTPSPFIVIARDRDRYDPRVPDTHSATRPTACALPNTSATSGLCGINQCDGGDLAKCWSIDSLSGTERSVALVASLDLSSSEAAAS